MSLHEPPRKEDRGVQGNEPAPDLHSAPAAPTSGSATRSPADGALHLRVVHGNLAFASHHIAVGHYLGDGIASAEKHVDRLLQFALTERLHLGLYPGALETNAIFFNPRRVTDPYARPRGAIVVGLGAVGALTASALTRSFTRALLEFVLEARRQAGAEGGDVGRFGVSALLIGTGAGGITVSDCVFALVRGALRANEALAGSSRPDRIRELELVELYHDRAVLALEVLDRLLRRSWTAGEVALPGGIVSRDGGLHRITYDEESDWWQRLQICAEQHAGTAAAGGLRFSSLTKRARTEVRLLSTQRALVDQFIRQTLATTRQDHAIGRTLFDLLLPNELKESAPDQDKVVLLLDEEAARYPWELLIDSQDRTHMPFAVSRGVLRQLEAREFRSTPRAALERAALVIGDPVSPFAELPGAQEEAEAVARVLQAGFPVVTSRIRPASEDVIAALFERPYQVLHLAGHGVYRFAPDGSEGTVTGMVIGDGVFLTPGEIAQMRAVPELVFINCCHLGRIEQDSSAATPQERAFPRLAANLATEFIRMGVRAVIAAGWVVDDRAATTFAATLYQEMMSGETLGEAVTIARRKTCREHPGSNTWGAYQCYGHPDFRLVLRHELSGNEDEPRFLSPAHALRDLAAITARLRTQPAAEMPLDRRRLESTLRVIEKNGWLHNGAIAAALGRAFGDAGELDRAVDYYSVAMASEDGQVTARDVEQRSNLLCRLAAARVAVHPGDAQVRTRATHDIRHAIRTLKGLLGGVHGHQMTVERQALLAGAYKRLAMIDPARRAEALRRMAACYGAAVAIARDRGLSAAYPLVNLHWAHLAMRWQRAAAGALDGADLPSDLATVRGEMEAREHAEGPQFWQDVIRVDCDLLEAVAAGPLPDELVSRIGNLYAARRADASAREVGSVREHLEFLAMMAEPDVRLARAFHALREHLARPDTAAAQP